jgi:2-polyprenyl-3-methyl-5-hydroxy-6-metoxy-1,4-benzoquinol methylase
MATWTRDHVFGAKYTPRLLDEFVGDAPSLVWHTENPFEASDPTDVLSEMVASPRWRHHHDIDALRSSSDLYEAYAQRVDALLEEVGTAMSIAGLEWSTSSFIDVAAAEGYVTNHLYEKGARDIDAVDLNEGNLRRIWQVRLVKGINPGRVALIDLEHVAWSASIGRTYDVSLALGIVYHLENPMLFLRNLFEITETAAVIESDTPSFPDNQRFRGNGVVYLHRDQVTLRAGNVRYFTEMRPDRQALAEMLLNAGFERVISIPAATESPYHMYDSGEKTVLLALR